MTEIVLTIFLMIVICFVTIRYSIPLMLEWLECMSIDDTTEEKE